MSSFSKYNAHICMLPISVQPVYINDSVEEANSKLTPRYWNYYQSVPQVGEDCFFRVHILRLVTNFRFLSKPEP